MAQVLVASVQLGTIFSEPNKHGRMQVWLDAVTAFEFYPTVAGVFYKKSVDAGETWGAAVSVLTTTPVNVDIYYERWGALSASPIVHVLAHGDIDPRGLYYNHVNLATEAQGTSQLLASVSPDPSSGPLSVCVARNGDIHAYLHGAFAGNHHYISSDGGVSFSSAATLVGLGQSDNLVLVPDFESADTADLAAILYDWSATDLLRHQWDDSAGAWTTSTTIDASVAQSFTQNTCVAVNRTTGHIKVLAFTAGSSPETLKSYDVYGTTVTARTNVLTSVADASICAISINLQGHVYAFYSRADHVYYKVSTDDMVTWGAEQQYSTVPSSSSGDTVTSIHAEPTLSVDVVLPAYLWSDRRLWVETPAVSVEPVQYRLQLAETVPIPTYVADVFLPDRIGGTIGGLTAGGLRNTLAPIAGTPLRLFVCSRGGEIVESRNVAAIVAGWLETEAVVQLAASSAVFVALACDRVLMEPTGHLHLHMPKRIGPDGEELPIRPDLEALFLNMLTSALARRSGFASSWWENLIRDRGDVWLSAYQAVDLGLADGILAEPSGVWRIPPGWPATRTTRGV